MEICLGVMCSSMIQLRPFFRHHAVLFQGPVSIVTNIFQPFRKKLIRVENTPQANGVYLESQLLGTIQHGATGKFIELISYSHIEWSDLEYDGRTREVVEQIPGQKVEHRQCTNLF